MSPMKFVSVIAGREIAMKLKDKAFLFSTLMFVVIIAASMILPGLIASGESHYVIVTDADATEHTTEPRAEQLAELAANLVEHDQDVTISTAVSNDPEQAVLSGDADVWIDTSGAAAEFVFHTAPDSELLGLLQQAANSQHQSSVAQELGLQSDDLQQLLSPAEMDIRLLTASGDGPAIPPLVYSLAFGVLGYMALLMFGIYIAQGVVEEKQSRVIEILVAAVPIRWLLSGKILGNTVMALGQIVVILAAAFAAMAAMGNTELIAEALPPATWFIVFFLFGFLLLSGLWAIAGAVVSRVEDLNSSTGVIQIFVIVPFFAAMFLQHPSPLMTVLSYTPFTSTLIMPARIAHGDTAVWEPFVSLAIIVVSAAALIGVASRIYAGALLQTGLRVKYADAFKAGREQVDA